MVGLGLGIGLGSQPVRQPPNPLCQAIAALKIVTATDGNVTLKLAPHVVYKRGRREIPTLDAVLIERNGQEPNRQSIRTYRVEDLTDITVTEQGFTVFTDFDPSEPEYAGRTICVVQTV